MATPMGHLPLAPITLNSQWRISIRTWTQGPTMNQEGANQRHSNKAMQSKTMREKLHNKAQLQMPMVIIHWPTADLPVNSDY